MPKAYDYNNLFDPKQACLKHYDFNAEAVINAVLEENLPPHLADRPVQDLLPAMPSTSSISNREDPAEISKKSRTKYETKTIYIFIVLSCALIILLSKDGSFRWDAGGVER